MKMPAEGLKIEQRCRQRFEAMPEREGGRFCAQCSEVVFDLSSLTYAEYQQWLGTSGSERAACVHGLKDAEGRLLLREDLEADRAAEPRSRARRRLPLADAALVASIAIAEPACDKRREPPTVTREPTTLTLPTVRAAPSGEAQRAALEAAARAAIAEAERELRAYESADASVASTQERTDAGVITVLHPHPPGRHVRRTRLARPTHFMGGAPANFPGSDTDL